MMSLHQGIGRNGAIALAIFLRSCLFEPRIGLGALRKATREFLDRGSTAESFEILRPLVSRRARELAEKEYETGCDLGYHLYALGQEDYPEELLDLEEPPPTFWTWGKLRLGHAVGIVGSRRCSTEGEKFARALGFNLSRDGATVVSGLARGIDSAAHIGSVLALSQRDESMGQATVAVLGSGLNNLYPPENRALAEEIVEAGGCLFSEYQLHQVPHPALFPDRNRVISALARSLVVVEAGERSGSLITARLAVELGREVFAVPGSVRASECRGSNELLRLGGRILLSPEESAEILPLSFQQKRRNAKRSEKPTSSEQAHFNLDIAKNEEEKNIFQKMLFFCEESEQTVDSLSEELKLSPETVLGFLGRLELSGALVNGHEGGYRTLLPRSVLEREFAKNR